MPTFYVTFEQAISNIKAVKPLARQANDVALKYYIWRIIGRHFGFNNTQKYGYTPNTPEYQRQKQKKFGNLPQLVLTGELKRAAENAQVVNNKIQFNIPNYGLYQIDLGRDFITPTEDEQREILGVFRRELIRLARQFVQRNSSSKR
jgi:hypothetical protein